MLALRCLANKYNFLFKNEFGFISNCLTSNGQKERIEQYYKDLNIPFDSNEDIIKEAFIKMAKRYHPDCGHPEANTTKFCEAEQAFRELSKYKSASETDVESIVHKIKHVVPQHREYLTYDGYGHGTPSQREKYWTQARASRAVQNVIDHRVSRAIASENTVMTTGDSVKKKPLENLFGINDVEDVIMEAISKGQLDNLKGSGEPLKPKDHLYPYLDYTTLKMNEYLINNGFKPEWVTLHKDINKQTLELKESLIKARSSLGPFPLSLQDTIRWNIICHEFLEKAKNINRNILTYNLIVPIVTKQRLPLNFDRIAHDILKYGPFKYPARYKYPGIGSKKQETDFILRILESTKHYISYFNKLKKRFYAKL